MSSALAIAAVTAILKSLLENGLIQRGVTASIGGEALVSVLPPDRITLGADERPQLNLFLHRVSANTGIRRPSTTGRDSGPGLALDLHYLVTAYGAQDFQAEILLGYAVQLLFATPSIPRDAIATVLATLAGDDHQNVRPPTLAALGASQLDAYVDQITIQPLFLSTDEMSKLWSSLQSRYRPSVAYKVSLVVIGAD
jgi:hypothetical protein